MRNGAVVIVVGFIYLAALFIMVRPGSGGVGLVNSVSTGLTNLIKQSTGGGSW